MKTESKLSLEQQRQELMALVASLQIQNREQSETITKLTEQIVQLQHKLDKMLNLLYGTKSEKRKPKAKEKLKDSKANQPNTLPNKASIPELGGRAPINKSLVRVPVKHEIPEDKRYCGDCHVKLECMGKVITEQLAFKPAEFFVKSHTRYKYKCKCCDSIYTADMPRQPIDKGMADSGVLAEVLINKYQDCLPLYRQQRRFSRHGIEIPISTLCDWVGQCAFILKPIVDYMKVHTILPGKRIFTDDTPFPVQDKSKKGQTHTGRLWTYVGGGVKEPIGVIFEYTKSRVKSAPANFLDSFFGYLQADAYPGYDSLYQTERITEVACWAHARRSTPRKRVLTWRCKSSPRSLAQNTGYQVLSLWR